MAANPESIEREIITAESGTIALLNKSEIDQQIETAKKYPRSVRRFRDECLSMVTLSEQVAEECIYAVPRDGKTIEGPSARFAEVVASAWGNCRAGARIVDEDDNFVTAQGVFHDLERNVAITYEVRRSIRGRRGRYSADMIGVTGNAACSIALRNAVLKGVPKAFWSGMYDEARRVAMGNAQTLANRRANALKVLQGFGASKEQVFATLGVRGEEDITLEMLVTLKGIVTALKDGDTTVEQAFQPKAAADPITAVAPRKSAQQPQAQPATAPAAEAPKPAPAQVAVEQMADVQASEIAAIDKAQLTQLTVKAMKNTISRQEAAAGLGVPDLSALPAAWFEAAMKWLDDPTQTFTPPDLEIEA